MAISKVVYGNDTLIDITDSTVDSSNMLNGTVGYSSAGDRVVGTYVDVDEKVKQENTTTNSNYRVLFSKSANNTTETDTARKSSKLLINPSTGNLTLTKINGNTVPSGSGTVALTSDIPTTLASLSDDSTHRLVTDTEKSTWDGKASTDVATTSANGLMSSTDKTKLDGIATGAEVNQNAFAKVKVGSSTVTADAKQDTLELVAGDNVTLTPDTTNDKVTIAATDTTYESKAAASGGTDLSLVTTGEKDIWNNKGTSNLTLGTSSSTAYRGDRGNTAYNHANDSAKISAAVESGFYKVACTAKGHIASLTAVEKSDITALGNFVEDSSYVHTDNNYTSTDQSKLAGIDAGAQVNPTFATGDAFGSIKVGSTDVAAKMSAYTVTTANTDLNDYQTAGVYFFTASYTPTNVPTDSKGTPYGGGSNGFLIVLRYAEGTIIKQLWTRQGTVNANDHLTFFRMYNGTTWSVWRRLMTSVDVDSDKAEVGLWNLIHPVYYHGNRTSNNVKSVVNDDGSVTFTTTAAANANTNFYFISGSAHDIKLKAGKYILSGCPSGGSSTTYYLQAAKYVGGTTTYFTADYGNGSEITLDEDANITVLFSVRKNYTISGSLTVYPVLLPVLQADFNETNNASRNFIRNKPDLSNLNNYFVNTEKPPTNDYSRIIESNDGDTLIFNTPGLLDGDGSQLRILSYTYSPSEPLSSWNYLNLRNYDSNNSTWDNNYIYAQKRTALTNPTTTFTISGYYTQCGYMVTVTGYFIAQGNSDIFSTNLPKFVGAGNVFKAFDVTMMNQSNYKIYTGCQVWWDSGFVKLSTSGHNDGNTISSGDKIGFSFSYVADSYY